MREIKFRLWNKSTGKFEVQPRLKLSPLNCRPYVCEFGAFDCVMQQFTGFRDADGVDIYEGDIVAWPDHPDLTPREVLFDLQDGFWRISGDSFDGFDDLALSMNGGQPVGLQGYNGPIKVIGHIFENANLLTPIKKDEPEEEEEDEDLGLESCPQCGEEAWDGYICHACGAKNI